MKTALAVIGAIALVVFVWWALKLALAVALFGYVGYHLAVPHWWHHRWWY